MTNWAQHIEDATGLPVAKRARHAIHFKNNDGSITANFAGNPVHYLDGGIWKPIDTKLIALGDGFYGCPHSKVKIKPDGTVAVAGTDYVQRIELPSAQTGLLDGDKLIRKFAFGEQRMWVTEDGFRSEIQLNRIPTLTEARKLIATESGTLSREYLKSLTTATDANGSVHTYSTLTAFRTWLASAVFPVTIDPDFSTTSGNSGDTWLQSANPNYNFGVSDYLSAAILIRYDLSSISSSATCTATDLHLYKSTVAGSARLRVANIYKITDANGDWVEGTKNSATAGTGEPCWNYKAYNTTAWAGSAGMATAGTDYVNTILAPQLTTDRTAAQYTEYKFEFNADGLAVVQDWFGDASNNGFFVTETGAVSFCSGEHAETSYLPVLTVTYTAGGSIIPIVNYYNRLRRN